MQNTLSNTKEIQYKSYQITGTNVIIKAKVDFSNNEVKILTENNILKTYTIYQFFIQMNAREINT